MSQTPTNHHSGNSWVSDVTLYDGPAGVRVRIGSDPLVLPSAGELIDQGVAALLAALVGQTFRLDTVQAAFEEYIEEQHEVLEALRDRSAEDRSLTEPEPTR